MNKKITVVGAGYVGLSLSVLLAKQNEVTVVDVVSDKVDKINNHVSPIKDELLEKYLSDEKLFLRASLDLESSLLNADFVIIATPTDFNEHLNVFDTSSVEEIVSKTLGVNSKALIVIKSTLPVGCVRSLQAKFNTDRIVVSPEFLRESTALYDNLYPSRIIISDDSGKISQIEEFASLLVNASLKPDVDVIYMSSTEAECVKLFSNSYLAMRVGFFNELDSFAEAKNLRSYLIIKGVSSDPRIGMQYNNPSFGYGGYCLPKDSKQLLSCFESDKVSQNLISAIVESNSTRKDFIAKKIIDFSSKLNAQTVGVYRLLMKTSSDNFRASAVIDIINVLKEAGLKILIFEPLIKAFEGCEVIRDLNEFKSLCDVIVANRVDENLESVSSKVYSRDLFHLN